jgi:hypothetical protein
MKKIKWLLSTLFLLNYALFNMAYAQCQIFGDLHKPKGKIKSFTEECYTIGKSGSYLNLKTRYVYNDKGLLLEQNKYKTGADSDEINTTVKYLYNHGKVIQESEAGENINVNGVPGNSGYTIKYLYDAKGNRVEKQYISDFNNYSERFRYDYLNNLIERSTVGPDGTVSSTTKFKYDINKHKIQEDYKDGDRNGNSGITNFKVDNKGNMLLEKAHFPNGKVRYFKTYKYDLRNNLTNEYCYTADGRLYWQKNDTNVYDNLGNWILFNSYSSSETISTKRQIEYASK